MWSDQPAFSNQCISFNVTDCFLFKMKMSSIGQEAVDFKVGKSDTASSFLIVEFDPRKSQLCWIYFGKKDIQYILFDNQPTSSHIHNTLLIHWDWYYPHLVNMERCK